MNNLAFRFEMKSLGEDGTFEGMLSVYNVVDLGGDLIEPGAFTKTISDNGGTVPMLWQHDTKQPIGTLQVKETSEGIAVKGKLILTIQRAREAYDLMKENVIRGLSIGYEKVKHEMVKGVRHLKEIKLYEGSIVTFPMLPLAQVTSIKAEQKADFMTELEMAQTYAMRHMMLNAICCSLDSIVWSMEYDAESKMTLSADSIDQFKESYMKFLPSLLQAWGEMKSMEGKAGRRVSAATRKEIEGAIAALMALLAEEEDTTAEKANPAAGPTTEEAAAKGSEPDDPIHSLLKGFALFGESKRAA